MAKAVSRRSVTTETLLRFVFSPCEICSAQIDTRTGFPSRVLLFSPVAFHRYSILIFTHMLLSPGQRGKAWELPPPPQKKRQLFSEIARALDRKVLSLFFFSRF